MICGHAGAVTDITAASRSSDMGPTKPCDFIRHSNESCVDIIESIHGSHNCSLRRWHEKSSTSHVSGSSSAAGVSTHFSAAYILLGGRRIECELGPERISKVRAVAVVAAVFFDETYKTAAREKCHRCGTGSTAGVTCRFHTSIPIQYHIV